MQPLFEISIASCNLQPAPLLGLHALGNFAMALSLGWIPVTLGCFLRRKAVSFWGLVTLSILSSAVIFLCGLGYLVAIWTPWYPGPWLSNLEKASIALICVSVARILWQVRSRFLSLKADLQSSEARWQTLTDILPMGVAYIDRQQRYGFVNRNYATWFECDRQTIPGQFLWDVLRSPTYTAISPDIDRVLAGNSVRARVQIPHSVDRTRDLESILVPDIDRHQQVRGFYALVSDVSERQATLAELRLLQRAIEVASNGISIADATQPDCPLVYVNSGFAAMTGYSARDIIGKNCRFLQGQETDQPELHRVRQALREGTPCQVVLRNYRRDGIPFWNQLSLTPVHDETGTLTHFIGIQTDISNRLAIEGQLRRSETLLRTIVQVIPLGIYVGNANRDRVLFCNRAFCQLWKFEETDTAIENGEIGHDAVMERCLESIALGTFVNSAQLDRVGEKNEGAIVEDEVPLLDGRTFRRFCVPVADGDFYLGQLLVFEDISDRVSAEAELRQNNLALSQANAELETAREAAETANRAKSEFLATMSHELRTPLNVILGFSEILARDANLNTEQQQTLQTILRSGEHLLSLINDILDLAKIEAGKIELIATPFNLHHLLANLIEMLQVRASRKRLVLNLEIAPDVPVMVEADEAKLRQILINLLGNAVKFTQTGTISLRARLWTGYSQQRSKNLKFLHLEVEDTGVGIDPQELEQIFQAFDRGRAGRQAAEGTGLGLTICQSFIQRMGGRIEIESLVGVGTIARCYLPVKIVEGVWEGNATLPAQRILRLAPDQPPCRILIVEDRWENRQMLVQLLTPLGFETLEAQNGQQAIEMWQQHQPQLILMDMRMPVMDGYEAVRRIRSSVAGQAVAIIALTASAFDADKNLLLSAGCNDFATKPVRHNNLLEKIARHLGVRYLYEEATPTPQPPKSAISIAPESFAVMPRDWVDRLNFLAGTLEQEKVCEALAQIPPIYRPLQRELEQLVEEWHLDTIYYLTQTFLETTSDTQDES